MFGEGRWRGNEEEEGKAVAHPKTMSKKHMRLPQKHPSTHRFLFFLPPFFLDFLPDARLPGESNSDDCELPPLPP